MPPALLASDASRHDVLACEGQDRGAVVKRGGDLAGVVELDELAARRMLAKALQAEVEAYIAASPTSVMSRAGGWWCAMAVISRARF